MSVLQTQSALNQSFVITSPGHQQPQTSKHSLPWTDCSVRSEKGQWRQRQTILGKSKTLIRLYKFGNVEQALQGAVLKDVSYSVC